MSNPLIIDTKFSEKSTQDILIARVTDIFLDPADIDTQKDFIKEFPSTNGKLNSSAIGVIKFEYLSNIPNKTEGFAKPLFPTIKTYPSINEIVFLIKGPKYTSTDNPDNESLYYVGPFNVFNNTNYNPQPIIDEGNIVNSLSPNKIFKEKGEIKPLITYDGDTIIEGRWGNSIRFGSSDSSSFTPNQWSSGSVGNPITIIRNGQREDDTDSHFTLENINTDKSSIYLTQGQVMPIDVASTNMATFDITLETQGTGSILIASEGIPPETLYQNVGEEIT